MCTDEDHLIIMFARFQHCVRASISLCCSTGKDLNGPKRQRKHLARIQAFTDAALGATALDGSPPLLALVRKLQVRMTLASGSLRQLCDVYKDGQVHGLTFYDSCMSRTRLSRSATCQCRRHWPAWRTCQCWHPWRRPQPATATTTPPSVSSLQLASCVALAPV